MRGTAGTSDSRVPAFLFSRRGTLAARTLACASLASFACLAAATASAVRLSLSSRHRPRHVSAAAFVSLLKQSERVVFALHRVGELRSRFAFRSRTSVSSSCVCLSTSDAKRKSSHASPRLFPAFLLVTNLRCAAARVRALHVWSVFW